MMYAYSEQFVLPISHDEVVHGKGSLLDKMPGDRWQQLANLRAYLAYMWAHPGKQLLFMGSEFAQSREWSEGRSLDWWLLDYPEHRGVQTCLRDMNRVYREQPALWSQDHDPAGFEWIDANDAQGNVFSWLRWGTDGSVVAVVLNFSPIVRQDYRIGLPMTGRWTEILNTDAEAYGGFGRGQPRRRHRRGRWGARHGHRGDGHPAAARGHLAALGRLTRSQGPSGLASSGRALGSPGGLAAAAIRRTARIWATLREPPRRSRGSRLPRATLG